MMVVRDSTHSISSMTLTNYQAGAVFPLLECASGQIWLAYSSQGEREALIRGAQQSEIKIDPLIFNQLQGDDFAAQIRKVGYVVASNNRFTDTPGRTSSIAVPVCKDGKLVAALVLVYFAVAMKAATAIEKFLPTCDKAQMRW
ncbi:MAG: hypothetical protein HC938_16490 [Nitrospira sp.]|nr:hypothetical protein [Nitrospira sp.]